MLVGATVSKPPSSDLNVNFICLSVCLSVCLSWMDRQLTVNHFRLLFFVFYVMRFFKTTRELKTWTMDSLTPQWRQQRMETTHRLSYSVARAIDIIAWQSVDAVCLCCLTHGAGVKVTGLQPLLTTV